jgi:16S rRNA U516 pseudouridylate synthase RsuA-like enzyme
MYFAPNSIIVCPISTLSSTNPWDLSQFIYELKKKEETTRELYDFPKGTMSIGRLDEDSEGLLLLTTDGMMSEIIRSKKVDKEYMCK